MFVAGDMEEIVCSHSELGDFRFQAKANEDYTIDSGGIRNNDDANSVTGSGQAIVVKNRRGWEVEGPIACDLASAYEEEALNALAAHPVDGVWTFSHISGMIRKGTGRPVGDIQAAGNTGQMSIKIAGGGKLEKI